MRVLLIGGSGIVGTLVIPVLAEKHQVRIFDLRRPFDMDTAEYIPGNVTDYNALSQAVKDMDAMVYMAMGSLNYEEWSGIESNFDVSIKGLQFALKAAHEAGINQCVYTSSMSVYKDLRKRYFENEDIPADAEEPYGFSKRLGEQVCLNVYKRWDMNVNVLRLCLPVPKEKWLKETKPGTPTIATTAEDVGRAILGALELQAGYQAFMISGDYEHKMMNMAKAKQMLNWEPLARPQG
jgi:nucleoside-diphosphate-sugar epimerase